MIKELTRFRFKAIYPANFEYILPKHKKKMTSKMQRKQLFMFLTYVIFKINDISIKRNQNFRKRTVDATREWIRTLHKNSLRHRRN